MSLSDVLKTHEAKKKARAKIVDMYLAASQKRLPHAHSY
jgi:hypothetical protein